MNRRFVLNEIKRLTDTEAAQRRAIVSNSNSVGSRYKLGLAQMALEKVDEAVMSFKDALAIEPERAEIHDSLGTAFAKKGDLDSAIACHHTAISCKPDFAKAMAHLGAAHHKRNELQEALAWNRAALSIDPNHVEANQDIALILHEAGQSAEAKQHLDNARSGQSLIFEYADDSKRTVLILWTTRKGNIPTVEFLFRRPSTLE
jgi:tetratricopeptide (TPR) repeat protein